MMICGIDEKFDEFLQLVYMYMYCLWYFFYFKVKDKNLFLFSFVIDLILTKEC